MKKNELCIFAIIKTISVFLAKNIYITLVEN